ncbi:MAG: redoxin family protein [bacterium]|nr:redoxin family protein [bacterium]
MVLLLISFIAGILTVLAPCVLPLLPVIVGGSVTGEPNPRRAYTIAISLGLSVILFTLLLKVSTIFINVPPHFWLWFSGGILVAFGLIMVFPRLWDSLGFVNLMNRSSNQLLATGYQQNSFWGDVLMGAALGPVFSSCSPTYFVILATVLPASFAMGLLDLLAYAIGLSGALLIIALLGQRLVDRLGITIDPEGWFRRGIGVLFIIIGISIMTGIEKKIELALLERGFDVTAIEQWLLQANTKVDMPDILGLKKDELSCRLGYCIDTSSSTHPAIMCCSATSSTTSSAESVPPAILAKKAAMYPKSAELVSPDGYINTDGKKITIGEFKGKKVVLIDIWTYSCINCQRTLPYLRAWYDTYHDQGLEIIGVHTPEFAFEKLQKNVQAAVIGFGIKYPVILDNEYKTWNAFGNQYWPRKYLIDIDGYIVYDHAGEGSYDEAEKAIQAALAERAERLGAPMPTETVSNPENVVTVNSRKLGSPEVYFGAARNEYFGNGTASQEGEKTFTIPTSIKSNTLYLGGTWYLNSEYAQNNSSNAIIQFKYQAKDVYFVASANNPIKIKVTRDGGKPLNAARGADVDADGYTTIREDRLYKLIEDLDYGLHTIEISIESPGLKAYTFTFG